MIHPGYRCIGGPRHNDIVAIDSNRYVVQYTDKSVPLFIQSDEYPALRVGVYELRRSHWTSETALVWQDDASYYTEFCDYSYLK